MTFLFRAHYLRNGQPRAVTFAARDLVERAEFVRLWESACRVTIDKVESCGIKRFVRPEHLKLVQPGFLPGGKRSPDDYPDKEKVK